MEFLCYILFHFYLSLLLLFYHISIKVVFLVS